MKIKISIILMIISLSMCTSCNNIEEKKEVLDSAIWMEIVNREWLISEDVFAGVYFYERDNLPICAYMLYGSGVPIIKLHESEVEIIDDKIAFEVLTANKMIDNYDIEKAYFTYSDGKLTNDSTSYEQLSRGDVVIEFIEDYKKSNNK